MINSRRLVFPVVALLVVAALVGLARVSSRMRDDQRHRAQGETLLRVSNAAGARLTLYRAGPTLGEAHVLPSIAGDTWVARNNLFLESKHGAVRGFYPIPLEGFHIGPDPGGAFAVTVRAPATTSRRWSTSSCRPSPSCPPVSS